MEALGPAGLGALLVNTGNVGAKMSSKTSTELTGQARGADTSFPCQLGCRIPRPAGMQIPMSAGTQDSQGHRAQSRPTESEKYLPKLRDWRTRSGSSGHNFSRKAAEAGGRKEGQGRKWRTVFSTLLGA